MASKKLKLLLAISLSLIAIYIGSWFYAAHHLEKTLKNFPYQTNSQTLSFKSIKVSGFPFKLKARITDPNFKYQLKNSFADVSMDFSSDYLKTETNLLLNHIKFFFPKKSSLTFILNDKVSKLDIISADNHYLNLHEENLINSHRIIQALYQHKKLTDLDFSLEKVTYHAGDLHLIDQIKTQEAMNIQADLSALKQPISATKINWTLKTNNNINILDSSYVGHKFRKLASKIDLSAILKPHQNIFSILAVDIKFLQIEIDQFKSILIGHAKTEKQKLDVDFILKLKDWKYLTNQLIEQKIISTDKSIVLSSFMKAITGEEDINDIDIKIYSSNDGELRIGNADMDVFSSHIQQFIMSQ